MLIYKDHNGQSAGKNLIFYNININPQRLYVENKY